MLRKQGSWGPSKPWHYILNQAGQQEPKECFQTTGPLGTVAPLHDSDRTFHPSPYSLHRAANPTLDLALL